MSREFIIIIIGILILASVFILLQYPSASVSANKTDIAVPQPVKLKDIPDDAAIIFWSTRGIPEALQLGTSNLYVMNKDGGNVTQITFKPDSYEHVAVSFDHRYIAAARYVHKGASDRALWVINLQAGTEARLAAQLESAGTGGVDWSSDGFIYFAAKNKGESHSNIFRIRPDGSSLAQLTFIDPSTPGLFSDVSVSEDGSLIAYVNVVAKESANGVVPKSQIWVMNADGSKQRMVDDGGPELGIYGGFPIGDYDPEISPDNRYVVFSRTNTGYTNFKPFLNTAHDIWIAPLGQSTPSKRITPPGPISIIPDWHNGKILYTEYNEKQNYVGLVTMNPDGTGRRELEHFANIWDGGRHGKFIPSAQTAGQNISSSTPVKLGKIPVSAEIVYHSNNFIYTMDRNGANATQITFEHPRNWEHVAVSYDHRYLVADDHHNGNGPARIFIFDLEKGTESQLVPNFTAAGDGGVSFDSQGYVYFAGSHDHNPQNIGAIDIYKIKYDGNGLTQFTDTPGVQEADPGVSQDSTLVTFLRHHVDSNFDQLWVMNIDGTNSRLVIDDAGPMGVASVHDPEVAADNQRVVFSQWNSEQPNQIPGAGSFKNNLWIINIDKSELRRLTKPEFFTIIPNLKDDFVLATEITDHGSYALLVSLNGTEQIPIRIKAQVSSPKWIPKLSEK